MSVTRVVVSADPAQNGRKEEGGEEGGRERTFLADEGETPGEDVHEVGQPVRVGAVIELPDIHDVVLVSTSPQ
jgi:hypothetical protein